MLANKATVHSAKQLASNLVTFANLLRMADTVKPIGARVYSASGPEEKQ